MRSPSYTAPAIAITLSLRQKNPASSARRKRRTGRPSSPPQPHPRLRPIIWTRLRAVPESPRTEVLHARSARKSHCDLADTTEILKDYKGQGAVEKCFGELKGLLAVAPCLLQENKRIIELLSVLMLAFLAYALIERQVRRALEHDGATDATMTGLYPGNRSERPPARMVFYHCGELDLVTGQGNDPP